MEKEDILNKYRLESATYSGSYGSFVDLYADLKSRDQDETLSPNTTASSVRINSVINVNDIPLPTDTSDTVVLQSAVFIEDGINYHSVHHRIDPISLKIYRIYYSRYVRWALGVVIFINMMLAFIEYPTSFTLSSDPHYRDQAWHAGNFPCGITETVELLCLLCFLVDCSCKFFLVGWQRFVRKPWLLAYACVIVISFVDIAVSLSFCAHNKTSTLHYTLRLRRYCRPVFFLISSTIMKKFSKAVALTLPQIFSVLTLLVLHLYIFAMIGLLVFPRPASGNNNGTYIYKYPNGSVREIDLVNDATNLTENLTYSYYAELEGSEYFSSVTQAFISLLVLLTTANHPDIMMPIYQYNRFSSIYFIAFLGIGTFLILNLLIAATYNQFKGFFQQSLQSSFFRRRVAFRAAFILLARRTQKLQQKSGSRLSYVQEVVSKDLIRRLLQNTRIPVKQVPQMYTKLEDRNLPHCLNWQQFKDIFDLIFKEPPRKRRERSLYYGKYRWLQYIQLVIRHRYCSYFTYVVSVINVVLITIELQISYETALERTDSRLAYYNLIFIFYYSLEQTFKLIGYGVKNYFRSVGNVYEGVLTIILIILEILILSFSKVNRNPSVIFHYDVAVRITNMVIVFRLLRLVAHVQSLRILISIIIDLFRNLSGFAGLMVVIYYVFALLGMSLFADVGGESNTVDPRTGEKWKDVCGTYDNLNYYANNFHDFSASLITLWDIMVVNNWFVFLEKFARDSALKRWSNIYFIIWWLVAAIIGMNLFVSLVLDTFLIKWEAFHGNRDEEDGMDARDDQETTDIVNSKEHLRSNIHELLQAKLVEPEEHAIMHDLSKHKDLMLVDLD